MRTLKHVGKMKNTGAKVLVVFRTLPGESNMALVLPTATLPDMYHDSIIQLVESDQAQDTNEFGEIMHIRRFPDGRPMLQAVQADGRLHRVTTDTVIMTPTLNSSVPLDQLNILIAEQKNCAVDDLAYLVAGSEKAKKEIKVEVKNNDKTSQPISSTKNSNDPLSDKDLAKMYRSQADSMYKEAARLRKQADELDPPQKKVAKAKEAADA
jgi:hypothetical protein